MQSWITWAAGGTLTFGCLWAYTYASRRTRERARRARLRGAWGEAVERGGVLPNRPLREQADAGQHEDERLDEQTWSDLLLPEVVERIDRTLTAVGSQTLWRWIRRPSRSPTSLEQRSALIVELGRDRRLREQVQEVLLDFGAARGQHLVRLLWGHIEDPELPLPLLRAMPWLLLGSMVAGFMLGSLGVLALGLTIFVANIVIHNRATHSIAPMLLAMEDVGRLVRATGRLARLPAVADSEAMRPWLEELEVARAGTEPLIRKTAKLELRDPFDLAEYAKTILLYEVIRFYRAAALLRRTQGRLQRLFDVLGAMDGAQSVASLHTGESVSVPSFEAPAAAGVPPRIEAEDLRHPLIDGAVGNSLQLPTSSVLVSGSNMSGKTTFLRTVAVNAVLAQSVLTVFARRYRGTPVRVSSCINISDDLLGGRSYFRAELDTILALVRRAADGGGLLVLDEIFRGTNPLERTAAATAVLDHLAANNMVLAATHDLEIGDRVGDAFCEAHFCEIASEEDDELDFDYRLRPGRIERPNAIALLGRAGFPELVVQRAMELVRTHERPVDEALGTTVDSVTPAP